MSLFVPEKLYTVKVSGLLTSKGREEIDALIKERYGYSLHLDDYGGFELVNNRGKITKRVKNNLFKLRNVRLDNDAVSEIGNIANNSTLEEGHYLFRISHDMDVWGQHHSLYTNSDTLNRSCFMPGRSYHNNWLAMDYNEKFYAVRVSLDESPEDLIARCWAMHHHSEDEEMLLLFNSYGLVLDEMSALLCEGLEASATTGYIYTTDLYINSGSVRVVGKEISPMNPVENLRIVAGVREDLHSCYECGGVFHMDDGGAYWYGEPYCTECVSRCNTCRARGVPNNLMEPNPLNHDEMVCPDCAETITYSHTCSQCNTFFEDGGKLTSIRHEYFCDDCVGLCNRCEDLTPTGRLEQSRLPGNEDRICTRCAAREERNYGCARCRTIYGEDYDGWMIVTNNGSRYCRKCAAPCGSCGNNVIVNYAYSPSPLLGLADPEMILCSDCHNAQETLRHHLRDSIRSSSRVSTERLVEYVRSETVNRPYVDRVARHMLVNNPYVYREFVEENARNINDILDGGGPKCWLDAVTIAYDVIRESDEIEEEIDDDELISRLGNIDYGDIADSAYDRSLIRQMIEEYSSSSWISNNTWASSWPTNQD